MKSNVSMWQKVRGLGPAAVMALVCSSLIVTGTVGCTGAQQQTVQNAAARIGVEIPRVLPLVSTATAIADTFLPVDALLINGISTTVQAGLTQLAALCNTYAVSPNPNVWASIVATVNSLVASGAGALLDAAKITDPKSRAAALGALGAVQTALLIIDGFVQSTRTAAQNATAAQARVVKLREIAPYLNRQMVQEATLQSPDKVFAYEVALGY